MRRQRIVSRSFVLSIASVALATVAGCVAGPFNGDSISLAQSTGASPVLVTAFIPTLPGTISVTQSDGQPSNPTVQLASYAASSLDATDVSGTKWFGVSSSSSYGQNVSLNPSPAFWSVMAGVPVPGGGTQNVMSTYLTVTATSPSLGSNYELFTFPGGSKDSSTTACLESKFQSNGGLSAIGGCGGVQSSIALHLNCGGPGQACCPFYCVGPTAYVAPCNMGSDGTIYECSSSGAGGVCQATNSKCDVAGYPPCEPYNCPGAGGGVIAGCTYPTQC
jgi:hypothetical protein